MRSSDPALRADPRHPTQIYEALVYLATFFFLHRRFFKQDIAHKQPGLSSVYSLWQSLVHAFLLNF